MDAKDKNKKVENIFFKYIQQRGVTCTVNNLNKKCGSMNTEQFWKYPFSSITPLYKDAHDKPGKRVLIFLNSGPGNFEYKI